MFEGHVDKVHWLLGGTLIHKVKRNEWVSSTQTAKLDRQVKESVWDVLYAKAFVKFGSEMGGYVVAGHVACSEELMLDFLKG